MICPICSTFVGETRRSLTIHTGKCHSDFSGDLDKLLVLRDLRDGTISIRDETTTKTGNTTCQYSCWICGFQTKQPNNFETHLKDDHQLDSADEFAQQVLKQPHPVCACGCGEKVLFYGWKHGFTSQFIKGHNYSTSMHASAAQQNAVKGRLEFYENGGKVWNDGLTKMTDTRILAASEKISEGLLNYYKTNDNWKLLDPVKAAEANKKQAESMRLTIAEVNERINNLPIKVKLISDLSTEYKSRKKTLLTFQCLTCNTLFQKTLNNFEGTPRCFTCYPRESFNQIEIYNFVKSLLPDDEIRMSHVGVFEDRRELDIFIPSKSFAIEFNGLTFHTENDVSSDYHWKKTKDCREKNITLLHIFSDEWRSSAKQEIVKSMIQQRLKQTTRLLDARKCIVRQMNSAERISFFEQHHIDGDVRVKDAWCLVFEGEIVMALSVREPRQEKYRGCLEIARIATTKFCCVRGGLGRLMKAAKDFARQKGFKSLLSYVDLRYGDGKSYEAVGFEELSVTDLRFWWVDKNSSQRKDRFAVRADSANGLSEREVAKQGGFSRIYGCPNRVMTLKL